ncbi:hypothetical protein [Tahibacter soli]|uniref:Uncharacterized protein n=1 Tax=Tahibacter soli TaxID=2983605 RepID=A0A9X3YKC6_9GAMM|nr:hypothetical protein [Tahibacter soli]MDC8013882.1 hypothetical protein [Tahibacter soli]
MKKSEAAYFQLVLLTERPAARIGRVAVSDLTHAEATIAAVLDLKAHIEHRLQFNAPSFFELAVDRSPSWWARGFDALARIGDIHTRRRLHWVLRIAGIDGVDDRAARATAIAALRQRRVEVVERVLFQVFLDASDLHEPLATWAREFAEDVPGFNDVAEICAAS